MQPITPQRNRKSRRRNSPNKNRPASEWGRWSLALLLISVSLIALGCNNSSIADWYSGKHGDPVAIVSELDSEMFPDEWLRPPFFTSASSIAPSELDRAEAAVRGALSKYPDKFLASFLDRIYLVGDLKFSGISAGGTNSLDRVYLVVGSEADGYSRNYVENSFHHEFSSILLRTFPESFREQEWNDANPTGFHYQNSGTDAIKAGLDSQEFDARLAAKGFFTEYSQWALEDDFNTIAAALFDGDSELWLAMDQFPPIQTKANVVIAFYQSLHAGFDLAYFQSLADRSGKP